ncbi:MAG: hypothetical protein KGV51_03450 [Moraxellaceae bacterium]|nr:hypothetical protein [Moraxellaceae bacterium]
MSDIINSNVCVPKCDVLKQNAEMERFIAQNPSKITYLAEGISNDKETQKWLKRIRLSSIRKREKQRIRNQKRRLARSKK